MQYAKTEEGVSIAFWTLGEGEPLVYMPTYPASHCQLLWQFPEARYWNERLLEKRRLVGYDGRGSGLSERNVTDYSLESQILDLRAVLNRLDLKRVALFAPVYAGPAAITYAARQPEQVSHLILWHTWARTLDTAAPQLQGLRRLLDSDWELYTETEAHFALGWSQGEPVRRTAALYRESVTQEAMQAMVAEMRGVDVTELLRKVQSPTLVLHRRQAPFPQINVARALASQISSAQLALLEGTSMAPYMGDADAVVAAIHDFLGSRDEEIHRPALPEGTAVILFADIADSTALTESMGDAAFRAKAGELDGLLRKLIRDTGGTPVEGKVLGDGVMAVFSSARQAIDCALRCSKAGDGAELPLHLGIHAGDVLREGNTVYGGAVNLAQRITDASAPGEILVSDTLRGLGRTSTDVSFEDRGERELKGIEEPQRLWAVKGEG